METEMLFHTDDHFPTLGIVASEGARELGEKINRYLVAWAKGGAEQKDTFLIENECPRFTTGDAKAILKDTVRGLDLYFLVDVGNYDCKYNMFGIQNSMSPDDHFQDLKRLIQAAGGKAHSMTVIMPLLYGGRQDRRTFRESLDCAVALQELENMGVRNVVSFDMHEARVQNAVPLMGFENMMPQYQVLKALLHHFPEIKLDRDNFMMVSPDEGAMSRNMYYASVLEVDLGMFYKRRDYSHVENGRNPIVAHEYLGMDVAGKTILIADDQIATGESMLQIAYNLKHRKAAKIFVYATYALLTKGLEAFDEAYDQGAITGVFGTNLTYRSEELLARDWFYEVDCSKYIAYVIAALNHEVSVGALLDPHEKIKALLRDYTR